MQQTWMRRPDPVDLASRRAEIHYFEAQIASVQEQRQRAQEHLAALAEEQTQQMEALRTDRARLAALDVLAREAGGHILDSETEEERRKLRLRLEERPATLAAALQVDLERLNAEEKELKEKVDCAKRYLAREESL